MRREFDTIIVGQGLAGTAVAWWSHWTGQSFCVIDSQYPRSASRVAAGIVSPITGQKLAKTWRLDTLWPEAIDFYRRVERVTGASLFRETKMVRLFTSVQESHDFERRQRDGDYDGIPLQNLTLDGAHYRDGLNGFETDRAGKLSVSEYLHHSRNFFSTLDQYRIADLDIASDVQVKNGSIWLPRFKLQSRNLVFCQGFYEGTNPWFPTMQFKPAKGEILTISIPGLDEDRVVNRGVWLAPAGLQQYQTGSTYTWDDLNDRPTPEGRAAIRSQLESFLKLPYLEIEHQSAIRPIHVNQLPVIGIHTKYRSLALFNGLGSKGTLQAPFFARHLVRVLLGQERLDRQVDLDAKGLSQHLAEEFLRRIQLTGIPEFAWNFSLAQQAHAVVSLVVRKGDVVIDATAGNGHDTKYLSRLVGPTGKVYSFDIQSTAIERTSQMIRDAGLTNVTLLQNNHNEIQENLPTEYRNGVAAVMFNLGYLPGGDKSCVTQLSSTIQGIEMGLLMLRSGGIMTILAYTGHSGGSEEAHAISVLLEQLSNSNFHVEEIPSRPGTGSPPRLFLVRVK